MHLTIRSAMAALTAALLLAACSQDEAAPVDAEVSPASPADAATRMPDETSLADPAPAGPTVQADAIPAALQGRWGLVAADCEPGRSDAKGLMEVSGDTLRFYESRGTLGKVATASANDLRAVFAFTGEGMEWTRDMRLRLTGDRLERSEFGADAIAQPLLYERCPA